MAQVPGPATNFLSPEDYAQLLREARDTDRFAQGQLQAPRHWTQALAGALGMGLSGYQAGQARERNQATETAANQAIADILAGKEGAVAAGMANPRSAQFAQQYQMQEPARERAAAEAARAAKLFPLQQDLLRAKIASAKAGPAAPAAVQQYNYAKSQGYQGSFMDFQKELKSAGKAETTINMPGGDKLADELAKKFAGRVDTMYEGAKQAAQASANVRGAEEALLKGTFAGAGAENWVLPAAEILDRLGIAGKNTQELIANTRQYIAQTGAEVGQAIKMFGAGTGLSDADRSFAQQIAGGNINVTPKALGRIIRIRRQVHQNTIKRYNELRGRLPENLKPYYPAIGEDAWKAPQGEDAPQVRASDLAGQAPQEGQTATNPQTGEKIIFQNGQWGPMRLQNQNRFNFTGQ